MPALSVQSCDAEPAVICAFPGFNCPLLEFPEHGAMQAVNCISCTAEVNGNLEQLFGALLQSSSKISYFLIFLLIFVPLIPQELSQLHCITCFDTGDLILSTVLEVFFSSIGSRRGGKKCFMLNRCVLILFVFI